jgi:hypothetical protein
MIAILIGGNLNSGAYALVHACGGREVPKIKRQICTELSRVQSEKRTIHDSVATFDTKI